MPCKACIFDLDGTLLDTLADLALACNTIMARHGWPAHETEKYRLFVGNGFARLMERVVPASVLPTLAPEELNALVREAKDFYAAHLWEQTMPYEGIPDALQDLAARGIRLGLLSNKPDSETQLLARHFFPDRFDAVAGSRPGVPLKPDPAALYAMLATLSVSPDETVYVGDSNVDMQTARNAGIFSVGVAWGFRGAEELPQAGAGRIISRPAELLDLLS